MEPFTLACPSCSRPLRITPDFLGKQIRCPLCQTVFTANEDDVVSDTAPVVPAPPPGRGDEFSQQPLPRKPLDRFEVDNDEEPRRRPSDRSDEFPDYLRFRRDGYLAETAGSEVSGPAIGLIVYGALMLLVGMVGVFFILLAEGGQLVPRNDAEWFMRIIHVAALVVYLVWGGIMLSGGWYMMNLRNYRMSFAAAVAALLPITGCCVLGLPFGIWALIVLSRPGVKESFH